LTVRYTLQHGAQTLKAGEARLADMDYFFFQPGLGMHAATWPTRSA